MYPETVIDGWEKWGMVFLTHFSKVFADLEKETFNIQFLSNKQNLQWEASDNAGNDVVSHVVVFLLDFFCQCERYDFRFRINSGQRNESRNHRSVDFFGETKMTDGKFAKKCAVFEESGSWDVVPAYSQKSFDKGLCSDVHGICNREELVENLKLRDVGLPLVEGFQGVADLSVGHGGRDVSFQILFDDLASRGWLDWFLIIKFNFLRLCFVFWKPNFTFI